MSLSANEPELFAQKFGGKSYYECHVTIEQTPEDHGRHALKAAITNFGWKFSAIEGDIVLGDGVKMYATRHYNLRMGDERVQEALHSMADHLEVLGFKVVRRKVERVIFDDRSSKVRPCDGGCVECHLDDLVPA